MPLDLKILATLGASFHTVPAVYNLKHLFNFKEMINLRNNNNNNKA